MTSTADQIFTATLKYITLPAPGFALGKGNKGFQESGQGPELMLLDFLATFLEFKCPGDTIWPSNMADGHHHLLPNDLNTKLTSTR